MVRIGSLRAELNCRTPETAQGAADLAYRWLEGSLRRLGKPLMQDLERGGPLSPAGLRDQSGVVPFGEPGAVWLSLVITAGSGRGSRSSISAWSPQNWEKFVARFKEMPTEASVKLSVLGADGYPDAPYLNASVMRYPEQSEWTVLSCDGSTSLDTTFSEARAERLLWAEFLHEHAERDDAAFGYLSDEADYAGPRTALEEALGLFPEETLAMLNRQVRGYSWITVVSASVVDLLGGAEAITSSSAFHEVRRLPSGSLWLQATADLADYDAERQRRVFDVLARALPLGLPRRNRRARNRRLVYEDAESATGSDSR